MSKDNRSNGRLGRIFRVFKSVDQFGETREFNIEGSSSYNSITGSVLTVLITALILAFIVDKFETLVKRTDYQIYKIVKKNNLDKDRLFS